jgi:ABC-type antimicrobial peptide transport system permease subunit
LAGLFAALAVLISCMGLFGLVSFVAEQRTKEISVRKVLGASVFDLWKVLNREFVMQVSIAVVIAIPSAYYFMSNWLQHYVYRSGLSWWIFVLAAVGALVVTLLTASYQSIKTALTNPASNLR